MVRLQPPRLDDPPAPAHGERPARHHPGALRDVRPGSRATADDDAGAEWLQLLVCLGAGIAFAVLDALTLPPMYTWFLSALPHEMGHATIGCLLGLPSAPAISLAGHAWTGHGEFVPGLALAVPVACAAIAVALRHRRAVAIGLAALALLLPLFAFTRAGEVLVLAGGHLGELAFATWCFAVLVTGGYTGERAERIAGATVGSIVLWNNLRLCAGLLTSAAARAEYEGSGSLGLRNDYLRLADLLHCRLQGVALTMLLLGLLVLPLGLLLGRWRRRMG